MKKSGYIANYVFNRVERLIDKKMKNASLCLYRVEINGNVIEYWDSENDLPVLVLLHGFGTTTKYQWFKQVEFLSKKFRLILPNLYHFGNSRPVTDNCNIPDQVILVKSLLNHLSISSCSLMGVSYGGLVAAEFTDEFPNCVSRLIIVDAPIKYVKEKDILDVCVRFRVKSVAELFVPNSAKGLKKMWHLSSGKKIYLPDFVFNEFYNVMYAQNRAAKIKLMNNLLSGLRKYANRSYNISIPVQLIWSDDDMLIPAQRGEMLKHHIGNNAQLNVIRKGGHMVNLNKSKRFIEIIDTFFNKKIR